MKKIKFQIIELKTTINKKMNNKTIKINQTLTKRKLI